MVRELRAIGAAPAGARVAVATTLPIGAGLSSSAALTVAAAKALSLLAGRRLTPAQLVEVAYRAEHDQVGVRCGRMDQTIAAHAAPGTALLFETATGAIQRVPFPGRLWVVETGVSHRLTGGELNQRRRECEEALALCRAAVAGARAPGGSLDRRPADGQRPGSPPELAARTRHVVTETFRTRMAADALARGDLGQVGWLLVEGHESLRVDYRSTIPEADAIVELAMEHGAYGARLTGAGWGGCVVVLAPEDRSARILAEIARGFRRAVRARAGGVEHAARRRGCGGRRCRGRAKVGRGLGVYCSALPARVAKLVDAWDLKSSWGQPRPGSNPGPGILNRCNGLGLELKFVTSTS